MSKEKLSAGMDRREFVRGAAVSIPAMGLLPLGLSCPVPKQPLDPSAPSWHCLVAVVEEHVDYAVYVLMNCMTQQTKFVVDDPDLPLGSCANPQAGGCFVLGMRDTITLEIGNYEFVVPMDWSGQGKTSFTKDALKICKRLDARGQG